MSITFGQFGTDTQYGETGKFDRYTASPSGPNEVLRVRILTGHIAYVQHYVPGTDGKSKPVFCRMDYGNNPTLEQQQEMAGDVERCKARILPTTEQSIHASFRGSTKFRCLIWNYDTERLECYRGGVQVFGFSKVTGPVKGFNDFASPDVIDAQTGFWKRDVLIHTWPSPRADMRFTYSVELGEEGELPPDVIESIKADWDSVVEIVDPRQTEEEIWRLLGYGDLAAQAPTANGGSGVISPPPAPTGGLFNPGGGAPTGGQPQASQTQTQAQPEPGLQEQQVQFPFNRSTGRQEQQEQQVQFPFKRSS